MNKQQLIDDLTTRFNEKKPAFLADVRSAVSAYIAGQGKGCLTLIERRSGPDLTWTLSADPSYLARLIAFCREKPHDGHPIDSALTQPVAQIVISKFEKLYEDSSDEIASAVLGFILNDKILSASLVNAVIESSAYAGAAVRNRAASMLLEQIQHFMHTSAGHTVTNLVGKTVAATVSKPVGVKIAALLVKSLSLQMKAVIAKVIASGAIKGMIAAAVKKFVIFAVAGAVVKAVAAKFGITTMAAFVWILIPVIAGYLAYEVAVFPKHLAEKVSDKVVSDLSGKYAEVNAEIMDKIVTQLIDTGIAVLVRPVAESDEVQDALRGFLQEI